MRYGGKHVSDFETAEDKARLPRMGVGPVVAPLADDAFLVAPGSAPGAPPPLVAGPALGEILFICGQGFRGSARPGDVGRVLGLSGGYTLLALADGATATVQGYAHCRPATERERARYLDLPTNDAVRPFSGDLDDTPRVRLCGATLERALEAVRRGRPAARAPEAPKAWRPPAPPARRDLPKAYEMREAGGAWRRFPSQKLARARAAELDR